MSARDQDYLPAYSAVIDGYRLPAYSDSKSKPAEAPRSKLATIKHILSGDAHKNHLAVLEAAAAAQPVKRNSSSQSSNSDQQKIAMKNAVHFN